MARGGSLRLQFLRRYFSSAALQSSESYERPANLGERVLCGCGIRAHLADTANFEFQDLLNFARYALRRREVLSPRRICGLAGLPLFARAEEGSSAEE